MSQKKVFAEPKSSTEKSLGTTAYVSPNMGQHKDSKNGIHKYFQTTFYVRGRSFYALIQILLDLPQSSYLRKTAKISLNRGICTGINYTTVKELNVLFYTLHILKTETNLVATSTEYSHDMVHPKNLE